jgi:hypothetical protein
LSGSFLGQTVSSQKRAGHLEVRLLARVELLCARTRMALINRLTN